MAVALEASCLPLFCGELHGFENCGLDGVLICVGGARVRRSDWLVYGYSGVVVLLVLFFAFEDSVMHRSRRRESGCLIACLSIVQLVSWLSWMTLAGVKNPAAGDMGAQQVRILTELQQIARVVLFLQLVNLQVAVRGHVPFQRTQLDRMRSRHELGYKAWRLSEEMDRTIETMTSASSTSKKWKFLNKTGAITCWVYAIFMTMDCVMVLPRFAACIAWASGLLDGGLFVYALWSVASKFYRWRVRRLRATLDSLVQALLSIGEPQTIEDVLREINVPDFLDVAHWRTVQRLTSWALDHEELTIMSKAMLLDALQKNGLTKPALHEAMQLIFSCTGEDVTTLKNAIDEGGDYYNLYKLIFEDIRDPDARHQVLAHFVEQAEVVRAGRRGAAVGVKVVSDIDDTLYSSGGRFPAGVDRRFPAHVIYPGVLSLYQVLDGKRSSQVPQCNLIFLSARPHVYKDFAEERSYRLFRKLVGEGRMHCMPTLLPGRLQVGLQTMLTLCCLGIRAWRSVGDEKAMVFGRFRDLYREFDFVVIGDNGQGDLWAAQEMLAYHNMPGPSPTAISRTDALLRAPAGDAGGLVQDPCMLGIMIHAVMPVEDCLQPMGWDPEDETSPIRLFGSYIGAALALHLRHKELVTADDLVQVASDAARDFDRMRLAYSDWRHWGKAESHLFADLDAMRRYLEEQGLDDHAQALPEVQSSSSFEESMRLTFKRTIAMALPCRTQRAFAYSFADMREPSEDLEMTVLQRSRSKLRQQLPSDVMNA